MLKRLLLVNIYTYMHVFINLFYIITLYYICLQSTYVYSIASVTYSVYIHMWLDLINLLEEI